MKIIILSLSLLFFWSTLDSSNATLLDKGETVVQVRNDGKVLMWLKDANYAHTSLFVKYFLNGRMTWDNAVGSPEGDSGSWINTLNASSHLGYNNWRLPKTSTGNDDSLSEMSYLFHVELGNQDELINTGPFENIQTDYSYWSSTLANPNLVYIFYFATGEEAVESRYARNFHAWAVRDIDSQGDLDGDFEITIKDALWALNAMLNPNFEGEVASEADVNGDGKIGIEDILYVIQKISGLR